MGPAVYKGHSIVAWVASNQSLQNAESLLLPEKALFHRALSISAHFVRWRFAGFFRKAMSYICHASPLYCC